MSSDGGAANTSDPAGNLLADPDWFPLRFDGNNIVFACMNRRSFRDSIFLDTRRVVRASPAERTIDCETLLRRFETDAPAPADVFHVLHMAHGGSTLLARALDIEGENTVYREPEALKQLGTFASAQCFGQEPPAEWQRRTRLIMTLLGRGYGAGPRIVKGALPLNAMIPDLLGFTGNACAILLYSSLDNYLVSVLKSASHHEWLRGVSNHLHRPIDAVTGTDVESRRAMPVARAAACIWLTHSALFEQALRRFPNTRTLDSELLFNQPANALGEALKFFGQEADTTRIDKIVAGDLFTRHSKFPDRRFDNRDRLAERDRLRAELASQIEDAMDWARSQAAGCGIPETYVRPLTGEPVALLPG